MTIARPVVPGAGYGYASVKQPLPRSAILRQPHMDHLIDHPAIKTMPDEELAALERLMRFCSDHGLNDPDRIDIEAFTVLADQGAAGLAALAQGLASLGGSGDLLEGIQSEAEKQRHRAEFAAISFDAQPKIRRVSFSPKQLSQTWQTQLAHLRSERAFAPSILDRMQQRLCMFAWSAMNAGFPVDLGSVPALRAFYDDLRRRSAAANDGEPRFAYLRSTWEELYRFATAIDLPDQARKGISATLNELQRMEAGQSARKFARMSGIPGASNLISMADDMLKNVDTLARSDHRHAARNGAAAIALGIAVPARPGDVHAHHILGQCIHFDPGRGAWRFTYVPNKTRGLISEPLDLRLDPFWNRFIDALILQDRDPRWLGELRQVAIETKRPLYLNYDGSRCSSRWYSRIWAKHVGTGGHIARSLIYDEMADLGEFGIQYAKIVNHHWSETIPKKYRGPSSVKKSVSRGQDMMIGRGGNESIEDLL